MTYQSVWWHPNYVEYGSGLNAPKTWPEVQEQYRRPDALTDLRYYDLPCEPNTAKLYYNMPRLGQPKYRATFRDKPFTHAKHYPGEDPHGKPVGFYGRVYYEDGPPQFKYQGPPKDDLYWLERPPYQPSFSHSRASSSKGGNVMDSGRGLNCTPPRSAVPSKPPTAAQRMLSPPKSPMKTPQLSARPAVKNNITADADRLTTTYKTAYTNPSKKMTMDGVGYL